MNDKATDNEKLIEEAAKAIIDAKYPGIGWGTLSEAARERRRQQARAAFAVFEKALTPTDYEREVAQIFAESVGWKWESLHPVWQEEFVNAALKTAGFRRTEVPEPSAGRWSAGDRREALGEALERWGGPSHDRLSQRDHDLYGMGARQGFVLGAEWWKAMKR